MEKIQEIRATGGCDCGGVRYRVTGPLRNVVDCHCEPCRRITGHHMAATSVAERDLHFDTKEALTWYQRTPTVRYGFCGHCGASLFWAASDKPERVSITAGSLDQPTGLITEEIIYAAEAGDYHRLDPDVPALPGDR